MAVAPPWGAYVVALLAGIVVNLLTVDPPTYYDIAPRDFGLLLAARSDDSRRRALGCSHGRAKEPGWAG